MSLNREKLGKDLKNAFTEAFKEEYSKKVVISLLADRVSKIIDSYIRSADVIDISVNASGELETEIDLPIKAKVKEGITVSGRGYTASGPIQVVAESVDKGTVVGNVNGKHDTVIDIECKQTSPGRLI